MKPIQAQLDRASGSDMPGSVLEDGPNRYKVSCPNCGQFCLVRVNPPGEELPNRHQASRSFKGLSLTPAILFPCCDQVFSLAQGQFTKE